MMQTPRMSELVAAPRSSLRRALSWLLAIVLATAASAQGGNSGGGGPIDPNGSNTNASSPGEEVTSLPMVNDAPGLTLVGSLRELRAIVTSVQGHGTIHGTRLGRGLYGVIFSGDFRVEFDRVALARSSAVVLFHGGAPFQGGMARLVVGSSAPVLLGAERVLMPVARLAGIPRAQGTLVTLDAVSFPHHAHIEASFDTQTVTLFQRLR